MPTTVMGYFGLKIVKNNTFEGFSSWPPDPGLQSLHKQQNVHNTT